MGGEGSGGSASLVLSLSFKLILWWQGRGLQSHRFEVLFVLFDLCRFCLDLFPLGFDFFVLLGFDSLLSLDWFLRVSVSFWVLISILFFGLISQFSSLALNPKLHDNSDPLNRWPEQPSLTQTFDWLRVHFLFTQSNWVGCESTYKPYPTQPMDNLSYGFGWVIWCCFQNKCGSVLANIKMNFKIDEKYTSNCELWKESELKF